jgi:LPS sulfotransferase NodH
MTAGDLADGVWRPIKGRLRTVGPLRAGVRRGREVRTYLLAAKAAWRMPATRFVIFAQGRTGSDLLASLLNSHPQVFCDGEILDESVVLPLSFVKGRCGASTADAYGYKLKIYHLTETQRMADPGRFLAQMWAGGWKIIYLTRRNVFRQALSWFVAERRPRYQHRVSNGPLQLEPITVDCDALLRRMKERLDYLEEERRALAALPHATVVYEDDLLAAERHQATADRIFEYLELPPAEVRTDLVKITPARLSDFIQNHRDLERAVAMSGQARFLSESG